MRLRGKTLLVISLAIVVALAIPATASAAFAYREAYAFSGRNADAYSYRETPDGGYSDVSLWGGYASYRYSSSQGKPEKLNDWAGAVFMTSFTPGSRRRGAIYREIIGFAPGSFTIDRKLTSATVGFSCDAEVYEWTGTMPWESPDGWREPDSVTTVPLTVSGSWAGTGTLCKQMSINKCSGNGEFMIDRSNSTYRDAVCSGSVIGGDGVTYFDGGFDTSTMYDSTGGGLVRFETMPF